MDKGGRPTKLTKELQEDLMKVIRSGNYIETACAYVGISKNTVYDWMKRGRRERDRVSSLTSGKYRKKELPYVEFSDAIQKALAHAEVRDVAIIGKAADDNWQAAAWRLERKFPDRWGRKDKTQLEHSGKDGGPIETSHSEKIDLSSLTDKELEYLENILERSTESQRDQD